MRDAIVAAFVVFCWSVATAYCAAVLYAFASTGYLRRAWDTLCRAIEMVYALPFAILTLMVTNGRSLVHRPDYARIARLERELGIGPVREEAVAPGPSLMTTLAEPVVHRAVIIARTSRAMYGVTAQEFAEAMARAFCEPVPLDETLRQVVMLPPDVEVDVLPREETEK